MEEYVVLVNENDEETGIEEKIKAHEEALLHRAFSVFIFNDDGEFLLQQRAEGKYHCPDLWTNTCCSHPREGEETEDAAHRRLMEEMGFDTDLEHRGHIIYNLPFDNGLTEHELDHLFVGYYDGSDDIETNPEEVSDYKWITPEDLHVDMMENPDHYTPWLARIMEESLIEELSLLN